MIHSPAPAQATRLESLRLLRTLIAGLSQSARAIESDTGLTNAQLFVLRQIGDTGGISVNDLAAQLHSRQNAVSPVLRRLVQRGYVARAADPGDARRAVLSLTPTGRRLLRRAPAAPTERLLAALESLPVTETRGLVRGLRTLVAQLGLEPDDAPLLFEDADRKR